MLCAAAHLDTLALRQADPWLLTANDENVALAGSELVVNGVLDVDDVETSVVALTVGDDTNTTHVASAGDHGDHTGVELDEVDDLAGGEIDFDGVVGPDGRVGVLDPVCGQKYPPSVNMLFLAIAPKTLPNG